MSYRTSSLCALCTFQPSTTSCEGCQRKFCLACLSQHRNELSNELDDLFNRRNELVEIISNCLPNNTTGISPCFDQINQWQNEMHATIDRIASGARDNVRLVLSDASKNVRVELDQISQDLQQKQKTGGYVEDDLNRIKQQLIKLNYTVQQFNEQIRIDTSNTKTTDWDSLLFVISNRESQTRTASTVLPPNPNMYNSFSQRSSNRMSLPNSQLYPNTLPPTYTPPSMTLQRPGGRSTSVTMSSRPRTYTCIGCKTTNEITEGGRSICSVCRCPAPF